MPTRLFWTLRVIGFTWLPCVLLLSLIVMIRIAPLVICVYHGQV